MSNVLWQRLIWCLSLAWLTGPIFDKELRVSSRRRRNYVLRCVHIVFFTSLISLVWVETVWRGSTSIYQASRMAVAGQRIISFVVWFQFVAAQVVAIVMLSTAISDEIYNKTLGLLMTTPVGSFQIVTGKLFSKLLQLILLLGITLPLLAIVRVFGGVPWDYLVMGLCVTLTTSFFLASLSLFFSIFTRRSYAVIIEVILAAGVLFAVLPFLAMLLLHNTIPEQKIIYAIGYVNPYLVLADAMAGMFGGRSGFVPDWSVHCAVALGSSILLVLLSAVFVRKVALRQATGQRVLFSGRRRKVKPVRERTTNSAKIRRVKGAPVLWKERRLPYFGRRSVARIIVGVIGMGLLVLTYVLCAREGQLNDPGVQVGYVVIFTGLGILLTGILPATSITAEKESRAWPILLTTTASNWAILWGKFLGALRRCSAAWLLLVGHLLLFSLAEMIHPIAILQFAILILWVTLFLCGTGLFFSGRFKRTTSAVIANLSLAAFLWGLLPLMLALTLAIARTSDDFLEVYMDFNPFVQAVVIADATAWSDGLHNYDWIQGGLRGPGSATAWMVFNLVLHAGIGAVFPVRTWATMRRRPV